MWCRCIYNVIYNICHEIYTQWCCTLFCVSHVIFLFVGYINPYHSGLLNWHWSNHSMFPLYCPRPCEVTLKDMSKNILCHMNVLIWVKTSCAIWMSYMAPIHFYILLTFTISYWLNQVLKCNEIYVNLWTCIHDGTENQNSRFICAVFLEFILW